MHPSIGPVAEQFRITTNLFMKAMSGVDADEAMRRPGPVSNPLLWLAGHVTHFRTRLLTLLGVPRDFPWGSMFDTGATVGPALPPKPPAVRGDECPADRESHPKAARLGGVEGLEQALHIVRQADAAVEDADAQLVLRDRGREREVAVVPRIRCHRVAGVHDEVEEDLLEVHAVGHGQG